MFTEQLKNKNGTTVKITRGTTKNQQKKYNSVDHVQRQFSFTKTSIKVSLKILSLQA